MRRLLLTVCLSLGVAAAAGASAWGYFTLLPPGKALPGTYVGGRLIPPGASVGDFLAARQKALESREAYLRLDDGSTLRTSLGALGVRLDVPATMRAVLDEAEQGSPGARLYEAWQARQGGVDIPPHWRIDRTRARATLEKLAPLVYRAPVDAHLDLVRHERVPDRPGRELDVGRTLAHIPPVGDQRITVVPVETRAVQADLTSQMIAQIDVSRVLSSYQSNFGGHSASRDQNVHTAARYLNGTVIAPRQTISFNKVVGPRTLRRGFTWAPVIVDDEIKPGVGGGTCQVSSTLHAAAVYGGIDVVRRRSHSRPSGYVPLGLDATVVYPEVDLEIKNPYDSALIIHAFVPERHVLRVEFLGRDAPGKVDYTYAVTNTHDFYRRITTMPSLDSDKPVRHQKGHKGYDVYSIVRIHLPNGREEKHSYRSKYWPVPEVYWVAPGMSLGELPALPAGAQRVEVDGQDAAQDDGPTEPASLHTDARGG